MNPEINPGLMYLRSFGLREEPFGVTPDPRFLYLGATHREALASMVHGIETGRGFMALIAEPGMGKTTLLTQVLEHTRTYAQSASLFQTQCNRRELIRYLLSDLGIETRTDDIVAMHEQFNDVLVSTHRGGKKFIVVIDEAHNLSEDVLESVRLLSDFETPNMKLLQIVLAGQPQLGVKLAKPQLWQLRQRISIVCHLKPLSVDEVLEYIELRLKVAGRTEPLFTPDAVEAIAAYSSGIPRMVNNYCFNLLSLAYALERQEIGVDLVEEVAEDLDFRGKVAKHGEEALMIDHENRPKLQSAATVAQRLKDARSQQRSQHAMEVAAPEQWPVSPAHGPAAAIDVHGTAEYGASATRALRPNVVPMTATGGATHRFPVMTGATAPSLGTLAANARQPAQADAAPAFRATQGGAFVPEVTNRPTSSHGEEKPWYFFDEPARQPESVTDTTPEVMASNRGPTDDVWQKLAQAKEEQNARRSLDPRTALFAAVVLAMLAMLGLAVWYGTSSLRQRPKSAQDQGAAGTNVEKADEGASAEPDSTKPVSGNSGRHGRATSSRGAAEEAQRPRVVEAGSVARTNAPSLKAPAVPVALKPNSAVAMTTITPLPAFGGTTVRIDGEPGVVVPGILTKQVQPVYPQLAKETGVQGSVTLRARINEIGAIDSVQVASGNELLADAAVKAVMQWRYTPFTLNGKPVPAEAEIRLNFRR